MRLVQQTGRSCNRHPAATATAAPSAAANTPASLPEVKLTWYFPGPWPQPEQDQVFAEVNKVIKAKINATVDFKPFSFGDYDQKMKVVIASGEPYDLAFTANWINNYAQNVAKGAFLPLDDLLAKYAPQSFANVPKTFWEATKVKGKIYGFVNQQISARTPSVGIPKDLADEYKFDINSLAGKINGFTLNLLEPIIQNKSLKTIRRNLLACLWTKLRMLSVLNRLSDSTLQAL